MIFTQEQIGEIRMRYRQAKNKKKQIGILAQLNGCKPNDIKEIVADIPLPEEPTKVKHKVRSYEQSVKQEAIKAVLVDGQKIVDVVEQSGVPYGTIDNWVRAARKQQKELLDYADSVEKEPIPADTEPEPTPEPEPDQEPEPVSEAEELPDEAATISEQETVQREREPEPEPVPGPIDITEKSGRLRQISHGLHCVTELMDMRDSVPDGYLTDLHDLLVNLLDSEIDKMEA